MKNTSHRLSLVPCRVVCFRYCALSIVCDNGICTFHRIFVMKQLKEM